MNKEKICDNLLAIKSVCNSYEKKETDEIKKEMYADWADIIQQAVDILNKQGEWIAVDDKNDSFDCSLCVATVSRKSLYCPGCGAKMKNGTRTTIGSVIEQDNQMYKATIFKETCEVSNTFNTIHEAAEWIDSENKNEQYTSVIETFEGGERIEGFFYTEEKKG